MFKEMTCWKDGHKQTKVIIWEAKRALSFEGKLLETLWGFKQRRDTFTVKQPCQAMSDW